MARPVSGKRAAPVTIPASAACASSVVSPTWAYAYVAQGVAAKANGMIVEARFALERAQRLAPDYELAQTETPRR